ncbi:MAG: ketoacyl-ACP synthase III [Gemmatimonadales bacterium]|nr:MAG: ketoacyl-ACP synthase III [Gemmatimonadales bacterium]
MGHHLPDRVVTNHDLSRLMDTSDEWIRERTGIVERRFVDEGTSCTDLAEAASRKALDRAGWSVDDVDFILFATLSPDLYFPGNGVLLQTQLGMGHVGALDLRTQCTGFVYALATADAYIRSGMYRRILVVGAEVHSRGLRMTNEGRDTAVLFGDGAGAACVEAVDGEGLLAHALHGDGAHALDLCIRKPGLGSSPFISPEQIEAGDTAPSMNGREVFKNAVRRFPEVIAEVLEKAGHTPEELDFLVPHQANARITEAVRSRMGMPEEKVASNIHRYGNTTAGSIPIALSEAVEAGQVKRGDLVCLAAFGAGFTWAASLLRW